MILNIDNYTVEFIDNLKLPEVVKTTYDSAYRIGKADDPFYVCDIGDTIAKHALWLKKLPRVEPFYAMKCNPNKVVLQLLSKLNVGFDCASKAEIAEILSMGVSPDRIIYANPCKQTSHIKFAEMNGVNMMTFDSQAELKKIYQTHPLARLVLRIFVGATKASCPLGLKFGAQISDVPQLLKLAKDLQLKVVGVSFHVGSGCFDASAYQTAIVLARKVFDIAETMGMNFELLDIGGGFPGNFDTRENVSLFEDVCDTISCNLDTFFPPSCGVRVIAEPGRYYVSSAFHLALMVSSIRSHHDFEHENLDNRINYFLNDGVYGALNCTIFDHYIGEFYFPSDDLDTSSLSEEQYDSVFWGPTCDSADKIIDNIRIRKLSIGEKVVFKNMGAYTMAAATTFNGFQKPYIKYVADLSNLPILLSMFQGVPNVDCALQYSNDFDFLFGIPSQIEVVSSCARVA